MAKKVYIFRGAPASGKGTVVPAFCETLPDKVALIEQDKLRWGFHLIGRSVQDIEDEEHRLAYENTKLIFEQYLRTGKYTIVLEGLFTWDDKASAQGCVKDLLKIAQKYETEVKSIVLKADKKELLKRNAERKYIVPTSEFEILYQNIYKNVSSSELLIDSTGRTKEETLKELCEKV